MDEIERIKKSINEKTGLMLKATTLEELKEELDKIVLLLIAYKKFIDMEYQRKMAILEFNKEIDKSTAQALEYFKKEREGYG